MVRIFLFLALFAMCTAAWGTVINVPAQYPTVQAAIDAAQPGDEVVVAPGTYTDGADLKGKAITLRSSNPQNAAIVAATKFQGKGVSFGATGATGAKVLGFTITGANPAVYVNGDCSTTISYNVIMGSSAPNTDMKTAGIIVFQGAKPVISHNTISNNSTSMGGGVYSVDASPLIENNTITGNYAESGGGIYCKGPRFPTGINNNVISKNTAKWSGAGIACGGTGVFPITGNTISENKVTLAGEGGGMYLGDTSPTVQGNTFKANSANHGGGICARASTNCKPTITGNTFDANTAADGGGCYCYNDEGAPGVSAVISKNTFVNNTGTNIGAAISACNGGASVISDNVVRGNIASSQGTAVSVYGCSLDVTGNTILRNQGSGLRLVKYSGKVANNVICGNSDGIYLNTASATIDSCTIDGNVLGMWVERAFQMTCLVTVRNTIFSSNHFAIKDCDRKTPIDIQYCDFFGSTNTNFLDFTWDPISSPGNIQVDPLYVDAANGNYRLKGQGGHLDDVRKTWVADSVTSPCIDAGDPKSPYDKETAPNGLRVNMGADGNTPFASKASTLQRIQPSPIIAPQPTIRVPRQLPQ